VRIELIVIDAANARSRQKDGTRPALAAPVLTKKTQSSRTLYKKLPGDSFQLSCEALGSPQPSLAWIHNGVPISSSPSLSIESVTPTDSGTYSCVASNLVGRVAKEFSLTVSSPLVEVPVISDISNVSVGSGETGVMQCSVSSSVPAQVKWLREVNNNQEFTVSVANMKLVVVESGQMSLGQGKYISNLVMSNVHVNNQGKYVCFATNTAGGFNYKTATLTVISDKISEMEMSTLVLALVIGLAVVVLILLVVLVLCVVKAKRKVVIPESPESHRTLMSQISSNCENSGLSIYRGLSQAETEKNIVRGSYAKMSGGSGLDAHAHSSYAKMSDAQVERCSSAGTNHYEVPYSHLNSSDTTQQHQYSKIPQHTLDPIKNRTSSYYVPDTLNGPGKQVPSYYVQDLCHLQSPASSRQRSEIGFSSPASQKWSYFQSARLTEYQNC